jgi:transporter family protein
MTRTSPPAASTPPETGAPATGPGRGTAAWLVPTLVYVVTLGGFGVTSKLALKHLHWEDLIFWMGCGYAFVVLALTARNEARVRFVAGTKWAILSAALAIVGLVALNIALSNGPASEIVPISASYPAVTLILSAVFLHERISRARVIGVVLVIGGVVVITAT